MLYAKKKKKSTNRVQKVKADNVGVTYGMWIEVRFAGDLKEFSAMFEISLDSRELFGMFCLL